MASRIFLAGAESRNISFSEKRVLKGQDMENSCELVREGCHPKREGPVELDSYFRLVSFFQVLVGEWGVVGK